MSISSTDWWTRRSSKKCRTSGARSRRRCQREIDRHRNADKSYLGEGIALLDLARNAQRLFAKQEPREKRRLLNSCYPTALGRMARWSRPSANPLICLRKPSSRPEPNARLELLLRSFLKNGSPG